MSYSIDRSRAVALEQRDGVWSLELEQLVRINRNTFRPRRQRVKGAQAIVQHLLLHHSGLVHPTRQVLESPQDEAVRFELQGSGWVMAPLLEDVASAAPSAPAAAALNPAIIQEITSLRSRVEHLERTVALLAEELAQRPLSGEPAGDAPGGDLGDELLADLGMGGEGEAVDAAPAEPAPDFPALKMPSLEAVADLVKGLVGDEVNMIRSEAVWTLDGQQKSYLALLNGDGGEPIGALVMNLEATVRLAGGMLMEPKDELDAQVEDGAPSDDILDAAGEVLNTLTSAVNKVSGNAHVRAGRLEELNPETHAWLASPRVRQDFKCSLGGLVSIVGR